MHFITKASRDQFQVCRMVPGAPPVAVAECGDRLEAERVRNKLDLMNEQPQEEPIPEEFDALLCRI